MDDFGLVAAEFCWVLDSKPGSATSSASSVSFIMMNKIGFCFRGVN
jgi:hypothetical protein